MASDSFGNVVVFSPHADDEVLDASGSCRPRATSSIWASRIAPASARRRLQEVALSASKSGFRWRALEFRRCHHHVRARAIAPMEEIVRLERPSTRCCCRSRHTTRTIARSTMPRSRLCGRTTATVSCATFWCSRPGLGLVDARRRPRPELSSARSRSTTSCTATRCMHRRFAGTARPNCSAALARLARRPGQAARSPKAFAVKRMVSA